MAIDFFCSFAKSNSSRTRLLDENFSACIQFAATIFVVVKDYASHVLKSKLNNKQQEQQNRNKNSNLIESWSLDSSKLYDFISFMFICIFEPKTKTTKFVQRIHCEANYSYAYK